VSAGSVRIGRVKLAISAQWAGTNTTGKWKPVAALFLLCLLWALDGLGPDLFPVLRHSQLPAMVRQAITYALLAVVAAVYAITQRAKWPGGRTALAWVGIGLLLFAIPVLLVAAAQGWVSQLERVAIFSLAPVFAVVLEPHLGKSELRSSGALFAALVAVAGALCIFPLNVPGSPGAVAAVLAVVAAAACAAIGNCLAARLATSQSNPSLAICAALASGSAALAFAAVGACTEHAQWRLSQSITQLVWVTLIDLPALLLIFWLLRCMSAARMTTRYILAPLLIVLAGIALEQPAITTRMVLGTILMAVGATGLLLAPDDDTPGNHIGIA
jgi:drug/metabolite transporter (DMT)-like permease